MEIITDASDIWNMVGCVRQSRSPWKLTWDEQFWPLEIEVLVCLRLLKVGEISSIEIIEFIKQCSHCFWNIWKS